MNRPRHGSGRNVRTMSPVHTPVVLHQHRSPDRARVNRPRPFRGSRQSPVLTMSNQRRSYPPLQYVRFGVPTAIPYLAREDKRDVVHTSDTSMLMAQREFKMFTRGQQPLANERPERTRKLDRHTA